MSRTLRLAVSAPFLMPSILALAATAASAGRPLGTEDAATADNGSCQVEAWRETQGANHQLHLAPACGVAPGVELGVELVRPERAATLRLGLGSAVKWVPDRARAESPLGPLQFGLKASVEHEQSSESGWRASGIGLLGLASLALGADWALHTNLGGWRDRQAAADASVLQLGLVWTPTPTMLAFAELRANDRSSVMGRTNLSAGTRWWLVPERVGLDLTVGREVGAGHPTAWSLGLGFYGIGR